MILQPEGITFHQKKFKRKQLSYLMLFSSFYEGHSYITLIIIILLISRPRFGISKKNGDEFMDGKYARVVASRK